MLRKNSIDLLRTICAMAVVVIHVVTSPVAAAQYAVDTELLYVLNMVHILMMWAVPAFFMITGYCLLKKENCTYSYCLKRVLKYICVLFTVGLFYALLEEVFATGTVDVSVLGRAIMNVISGNLWDHMWFVYSIIGIYLVMPVIHNFIKQSDTKSGFILTGLLFFFGILCPYIEILVPVGIDFPFGGYLFYVCLGAMIAKCSINKKVIYTCWAGLVLSVVYIVFFGHHAALGFGYNSISVCTMAVCIFVLISQTEIKSNKFMLGISRCTWGIYLIHPFFINIVLKVLKINLLFGMPYLKLCAFWAVIFSASFATVYVLRKIPLIKKLF